MELTDQGSTLKLIVQEKKARLVEDRKKGRKMYCTTNEHPFAASVCEWN
jgi:hypothetical protein